MAMAVEMGVDEAAAQLGLSQHRVRYLIHSGRLPARRVAGRWLVERADVERLAEGRSPGRPLSPRVAWGLIALLDRGDAPWLSAPERSRLRARMRAAPSLDQLARACRGRAHVHRLHVHPGALPRALAWPGAVPTGASAGGHDVVDARQGELYLPEADVVRLRKELRARPAGSDDANLVIRVPAGGLWPFPDGAAGPMAVALDLWDAGDSRSRRAAQRLYHRARAVANYETHHR
ncbi:MAG TPA: helix-turn-helix domain-containing protein [Acidimicrobiia bacterium]|nr:helix-turn-helix domain-containing protein [Acidimicrobiia bacterium]